MTLIPSREEFFASSLPGFTGNPCGRQASSVRPRAFVRDTSAWITGSSPVVTSCTVAIATHLRRRTEHRRALRLQQRHGTAGRADVLPGPVKSRCCARSRRCSLDDLRLSQQQRSWPRQRRSRTDAHGERTGARHGRSRQDGSRHRPPVPGPHPQFAVREQRRGREYFCWLSHARPKRFPAGAIHPRTAPTCSIAASPESASPPPWRPVQSTRFSGRFILAGPGPRG